MHHASRYKKKFYDGAGCRVNRGRDVSHRMMSHRSTRQACPSCLDDGCARIVIVSIQNTYEKGETKMAKVIVDDAEVVRAHRNGGGFAAHKKKTLRNGETMTEKYTVWTTDPIQVGSVVSFEGLLSVKVEEFTNDDGLLVRYAAIHVNDPVLTQTSEGSQPSDDAPF